ncbi:MAG: hypothetical protein R3C60_03340 [Parvularculaceae bacterium]
MLLVLTMIAEAAAHDAADTKGGLPQLDASTFPSQIFWLAVTFLVLYWVMSSMILPRLGGAIEERRDRIADDLDQAHESHRQAEEAEAAYERALADARAKAQAIAAETRDEVASEVASIQHEAEAELAAKAASAEERISEMRKSAAAKVREAANDTTRAVVEALINETPTDPAVAAAVAKVSGA